MSSLAALAYQGTGADVVKGKSIRRGQNSAVRTISVAAPAHGRVLVRDVGVPRGLLVGFHGYLENADIQMERLATIPGTEQWTLVSAQGLHRFYKGRTQDVVASWMTRQDREEAIRDNIAYVDNVVEATRVKDEPIVYVGFSQGVATAFRAALRGSVKAVGVIAVGGDVPPELLSDANSWFPRVLLLRGVRDDWYTAEKMGQDYRALRPRVDAVETLEYDAGHEWTADVARAAGEFIQRVL
jgi:predicted esterase